MPGTWLPLVNQPQFDASTMILLTDGTVLCQAGGGNTWSRLTPDAAGDYLAGTWTSIAPMNQTRLYYASAVLADGRLFVAGGEYSDAGGETNTAEIYDPTADTWTVIPAPPGWNRIGDAACVVLADGRLLLGQIDDGRTALFDPATDTWTAGPNKGDPSSEESWVLMPDGTVVVVQCTNHPGSEKYLPLTNRWMAAPPTPDDLVEAASIETGAGVLLPDGRALFIGATPHTALYTAGPSPNAPGAWSRGPGIPDDGNGRPCAAKDAPGCLLRSGHVLVTVGPVDGVSGDYLGPTYFFEFDGKNLVKVADAPNAGSVPYVGRMLLLPTGDVLYAAQTAEIQAYRETDTFQDAWQPTIVSAPPTLVAGLSFTLSGTQLNGLSQAVGYGDDAAGATNYPLVRLGDANGLITYCRTFGHSTMAVATGAAVHTTNFHVPASVAAGSYELSVVANGIPSEPVEVSVSSFQPQEWREGWLRLIGSLADGPLWAIGPNGPVPVDPWGPKVRASAKGAVRTLVAGIKALQKIGKTLDKTRLTAAKKVPPATDPELEELLAKISPKRSPAARKRTTAAKRNPTARPKPGARPRAKRPSRR